MQIFLNGESTSVPQGTTLAALLPEHPAGCGVAVLRPGVAAAGDADGSRDTSQLRFVTNAGDIVVELLPGVVLPVPTGDVSDANLRVHWEDKYAVAFGPFRADFIPDRQS